MAGLIDVTPMVAGVDEAGRGPLAGPVYAAAVILPEQCPIDGIGDSKKLSAARREALAEEIRAGALAASVGLADAREIDELNILQATFLAMQRAVAGLSVAPQAVRVDGNRAPRLARDGVDLPVAAIVGGDGSDLAIGAASILAKVARDRYMLELDQRFPHYGFARHKGYPTAAHREALERFGPCPEHRNSFKPVRLAARARRESS